MIYCSKIKSEGKVFSMIIELPKKFYSQFAYCEENMLYIRSLFGLENLMYDLTKALKGKNAFIVERSLIKVIIH